VTFSTLVSWATAAGANPKDNADAAPPISKMLRSVVYLLDSLRTTTIPLVNRPHYRAWKDGLVPEN
jgi:hypothetical protein